MRPPQRLRLVSGRLLWLLLTSPPIHDKRRPPQVRHLSFLLSRRHLQRIVCWSGALQRCACSPTTPCLLCRFCSSVQKFAVPLPSLHGSRQTSLRLANWLHQLANKGFAPSGYSEYITCVIYPCHAGHTHQLKSIKSLLTQPIAAIGCKFLDKTLFLSYLFKFSLT